MNQNGYLLRLRFAVEYVDLQFGVGARRLFSRLFDALGAREQGLRVLLMDKGKLESSGCIGGGNDHYMAILDEKDTPFDGVEDLVKFYAKPLNGWTTTARDAEGP